MSKYLSANFDRERGDALTITREEAVAFREVGKEIGATILWALVAEWFAGNPGDPVPKMKDPRDQRDLARLIEHQKANVSRCVVNAAKKQENARERWGRPPEEQPSEDMQMHTKKCKCIKGDANADKYSKDKDKISSSDKLESLSMSIKNVGPSGVANVAPPGGGTFARTATNKEGKTFNECKLAEDPIGYMIRFADYCADIHSSVDVLLPDDKAKMIFRRTLESRVKQLGHDVFVSCCFDFIGAYCEASQWFGDDGDKTYGDRIFVSIMGQLKDRAIGLGVATK